MSNQRHLARWPARGCTGEPDGRLAMRSSTSRGCRLGAGGVALDRLCTCFGILDRARFCQLLLVPLLAHEEANSGRHLANAVADGEAELVDLEDHLLEVGQLF